jgi:hypothetical protein
MCKPRLTVEQLERRLLLTGPAFEETTDRIGVFSDQLQANYSDALVQFIATHYAGTQKMLKAENQRYLDINPAWTLLHYDLGVTKSPAPLILNDQWGSDWSVVNSHEDWWMHNADGVRLHNDKLNADLQDITNPAWRQYWSQLVISSMRAEGAVATFADSFTHGFGAGWHSVYDVRFIPGPHAADPAYWPNGYTWQDRLDDLITYMVSALGNTPEHFIYMPNLDALVTSWQHIDTTKLEAAFLEHFGDYGGGGYMNGETSDWVLAMNRALPMTASKIIIIEPSLFGTPDSATGQLSRNFLLGTYLLMKGDHTYLNIVPPGTAKEGAYYYPEYQLDFGTAVTPLATNVSNYLWNGLYRRDYQNGIVLVNPGNTPITVNLGGDYFLAQGHGGGLMNGTSIDATGNYDGGYLTYQQVSSVTVPAGSAALLMNNAGPPDIRVLSATTDGGTQLTVTYQIATSDVAAPFDLSFYRSNDAQFDNSDTALDTVTLSNAADGTIGMHTKVFTIGGAAGQIALPGAGAAQVTGDYQLLAVLDPTNAVSTASVNKTAVLTGAYHVAGGGVFVQGGLVNDTLTLSVTGSNLSVVLNGTTYSYAVSDTALVQAWTHAGNDTVNVLSTALNVPVTTYLGSGNETVNVGDASNTLNGIQGPLVLDGGGGTDQLLINDQGNTVGQSFTVTSISISRSGTASISYTSLKGITINAGSGNDTATIVSTPSTTPVTINGGAGLDTLVGPNLPDFWTISSANGGKVRNVSFTGMENLTGGTGADIFQFSGTGNLTGSLSGGGGGDQLDFSLLTDSGANGRAVTVNLQTGVATRADGLNLIGGTFSGIRFVAGSTAAANTLIGPNAFDTWNVTGANAGNIKQGLTAILILNGWKSFQKLVGGTDVDVFQFTAAGTETSIDGGTAPANKGNWLDYLSVGVPVTVNLATGATSINGVSNAAVANIQDVRGGSGGNTLTGNALGNILLGGTGNDSITGGSGRSLLIGDKGSDSITGNSGNDILIGDATSYDTWTMANDNIDRLMSILAEWQSANSYATRFANLQGGGGLNGSNKLIYGTTVNDDTSADTLTALSGSAQNWFFQSPGDTLVNFLTGDHLNNT